MEVGGAGVQNVARSQESGVVTAASRTLERIRKLLSVRSVFGLAVLEDLRGVIFQGGREAAVTVGV